MSDQSKIEWCDSTFNPWIGCTKVSAGCDHCYAEADFDLRKHRVKWGAGNPRSRTSTANWKKPLQWNGVPFYECKDCGVRGEAKANYIGYTRLCASCNSAAMQPARRRVFCASLADVFDNEVPVDWRADLFALIQRTPCLDWLLLTKRIGNVHALLPEAVVGGEMPENVRLGATICNQAEAERDIPKLLRLRTANFLSIEPLLGPVDIGRWLELGRWDSVGRSLQTRGIDWVIAGGESGPKARPMHSDWVRSLRDQCGAAGVPFLFKQWGEWHPSMMDISQHRLAVCKHGGLPFGIEPGKRARSFDLLDRCQMHRVGKKAAGRLLDGVTHDGYPQRKGPTP